MEPKNNIPKAKKVMAMSEATKAKLAGIAKNIKGKELFPEKVDLAKHLAI